MKKEQPLISVVMSTYNHEKYIAEAIESVLEQTLTNFEFIIVNDGSTDKTDEIIRQFQDERIIYINQKNQGSSTALNNGILQAQGKYVAFFSGDDVCYPQRLERQSDFLDKNHKKIVFSWVDFIDDNSQFVTGEHFAQNFFNQPHKNRSDVLQHFFFRGNYLSGPTGMVEKNLLLEAGLFLTTSIQLQDLHLWLKLLRKDEIFMSPEKLLKYRIRLDNGNLSNPVNSIRSTFEYYQISKSFFDDLPVDLFKEAFKEQLRKANFQGHREYELEKAFLYLHHNSPLIKSIGGEKLFNLLQDRETLAVSESEYNFSLIDLYKLNNDMDIANLKSCQYLQWQMALQQQELQNKHNEIEQLQIQLSDGKMNVVVFPDWNLAEELLYEDLAKILKISLLHPEKNKIKIWIENSEISQENANLIISDIMMSILMEEDLEINEEPEISLFSHLEESVVLNKMHARLVLNQENKVIISKLEAEKLPQVMFY
ncbi:MAG: glycosyltransferase family 2 protein [Crinalium sp.]